MLHKGFGMKKSVQIITTYCKIIALLAARGATCVNWFDLGKVEDVYECGYSGSAR
jgi:hypothetical protein